jgi:AAA family ATP:ADP antiporter
MKDRFLTLLGIESGEESMISMLITQSVFLGIFFGAFDISAHSLFLSIFDEKMMARGYVVSGIAGIILTSIYTWQQTRTLFRSFATANLFFVTSLTLVLWLLLIINQAKWIVFLVFIMLGPLNILAMLGFWGTVGRLFTLRQGKRLFGLVDAGLIIGVIISCYAIPVLLSFNFSPHNILLISAAAVLTGSVMQIVIGRKFLKTPVESKPKQEKAAQRKSVFMLLREDSYIRIMGIFIALSVMTAFFVQYSFMAVTREQYPAEEDMARFLGIFTGSMMIFTLLIKLLVFAYLIRNYGLRTCLALSPVLIATFSVVAIVIGTAMGYTPATSGFMLFFMLLALSRLFSKSLKDSIESPSFKVIYQTIDEKVRFEVQSGMDGTINEMAALTSGLLLAGLGILSFIKLIHFSIVLFFITLLWIYFAIRLYSEYRNSIRKALESGKQAQLEAGQQHENVVFQNDLSARMLFQNEYYNLIIDGQRIIGLYGNNRFFENIIYHAEGSKDINLITALKNISIHAGATSEIRQRSAGLAESLELILASPQQKDEKLFGAQRILAGSREPQTTQVLRLLRDNITESKKLAICMIGKFRMKEMIPEVCGCLNIPGLETYTVSVLKSFGADADDNLRKYYLISSGNSDISKKILRILAKDCRPENQSFLYSRLWSNSREIKELALSSLKSCDYKAPDEEKDHLYQLISDLIGVMVWNLSARVSLRRNNDNFLLEVLNKEIARWHSFLFNILSITYDSRSIGTIRENIESATVASVNYALEMIDMVIDESLKPKLIPLLDIISDEDKVKSLYQFYPGEIPEYNKLIDDIINRDYNLVGIWTKACAIRNILHIKGNTLGESVIALLFSPEPILREESVRLLARSDREIFSSVSGRIPSQIRSRLDQIINGSVPSEDLLFEKVRFLSETLNIPEEDCLLPLAESMKYIKSLQESMLPQQGSFILWSFTEKAHDKAVNIFDRARETAKIKVNENYDHHYYLTMDFVQEFCGRFPEKSEDILYYIEING